MLTLNSRSLSNNNKISQQEGSQGNIKLLSTLEIPLLGVRKSGVRSAWDTMVGELEGWRSVEADGVHRNSGYN